MKINLIISTSLHRANILGDVFRKFHGDRLVVNTKNKFITYDDQEVYIMISSANMENQLRGLRAHTVFVDKDVDMLNHPNLLHLLSMLFFQAHAPVEIFEYDLDSIN